MLKPFHVLLIFSVFGHMPSTFAENKSCRVIFPEVVDVSAMPTMQPIVFEAPKPVPKKQPSGLFNENNVIEALQYLFSINYPLNSLSLRKDVGNLLVNSSLSKIIGFSVTPKNIYHAAQRIHSGAWEWWLLKAGIDPLLVIKKVNRTVHLDLDQIKSAVRSLDDRRIPVNKNNMVRMTEYDPVFLLMFGRNISPAEVFNDFRSLGRENWTDLLREMEIYRLSEDEIIKAIQFMNLQGQALNAKSMQVHDYGDEFNKQLSAHVGRITDPAKVYDAARDLDPVSWDVWLRKAGLNSFDHIRKMPDGYHLTPRQIVDILKAYKTTKATNYIGKIEQVDFLRENVPFPVTLQKVYLDATRFHQTPWQWWAQRADKRSRSTIFISVQQIIDVIIYLNSVDHPLQIRSIERDQGNEQVNAEIFRLTGYNLSPAKIYDQATRSHNRSWDWWRTQADVDSIFYSKLKERLTEVQIVSALRFLAETSGITILESNQIRYLRDRTLPINVALSAFMEFPVTASQVFGQAVRVMLRPWDEWLVKAGFNPNEIRRRGNASVEILDAEDYRQLASHYNALIGNGSGMDWVDFGIGERVPILTMTAEDIVIVSEYVDGIGNAQQNMNATDSDLLDQMLEYFSLHNDFDVQKIAEFTGTTPAEITALLAHLRESNELQALFYAE